MLKTYTMKDVNPDGSVPNPEATMLSVAAISAIAALAAGIGGTYFYMSRKGDKKNVTAPAAVQPATVVTAPAAVQPAPAALSQEEIMALRGLIDGLKIRAATPAVA